MKVAIQGIKGSFHAQAAQQLLGEDAVLLECETFREVFATVEAGRAERGIVAVENSLHGSINAVYRLLAEKKLSVCGEARLKIELFLLAAKQTPEVEWSVYDKVISQAEALSQCESWLAEHFEQAHVEETYDTASAVQWLMSYPDEPVTAIAGRAAAELYKAKVLAGPINDDSENYTRFFLLSKEAVTVEGANRTSLILTESQTDKPGTLYDALGLFKQSGINLSKLDSHPLPGKSRRYAFYVDFDTSAESPAGSNVIEKLQQSGWAVQVLGSYRAD